MENTFQKLLFKLLCVYLPIEKLVNEKYFLVKKNWFDFRKVFFFILNGKYFLKIMKKFEKIINVMLFANYIQFDTQTFDCYIFCFEFIFSISSLIIWFNLIFKSILILIFMIIICFSLIIFLIKIFYLSNLIFIILSEIIYEIIYFLNFILIQPFNL